MRFDGFTSNVKYIPVPAPFFGHLLESISDEAEFKCTLRTIYLLHMKRRTPKYVREEEIIEDGVLVKSLSESNGTNHPDIVKTAMKLAVSRGTFLLVSSDKTTSRKYMLNTEHNRKLATKVGHSSAEEASYPWKIPNEQSNIFSFYEDNIGMLTPWISDRLIKAQKDFPLNWIKEAIEISISNNRRNWSYISRILETWSSEGKNDGKHTRDTGKTRYR